VQNKIGGVKVDAGQFTGDPVLVEHSILLTSASAVAQAAIQAGIEAQASPQQKAGPMVAGLTLGSPDFQRR
jgi:hypothetical protein